MNTLDKENSFPAKTTFRSTSRLFFDTDTKKTFTVTEEQWQRAKGQYNMWDEMFQTAHVYPLPFVQTIPHFIIETETGTHINWFYDTTEDYSEFLK